MSVQSFEGIEPEIERKRLTLWMQILMSQKMEFVFTAVHLSPTSKLRP